MQNLANFFEIDNVTVSYILGIVLIIASIGICALCIIKKNTGCKSDKILSGVLSIVSLAMTVISGFCAYHIIITLGYIASVIAFSLSLAKLNINLNFDKSFDITLPSAFIKLLFPVSILFLCFGPWFIDSGFYGGDTNFYSVWAMFGMKGVGVYAFSFDNLHITTFIELGLFALLAGVQIYTIARLFINPDYCGDWSLFHLIITVITALFINGIYTSNNFIILNNMPPATSTVNTTLLFYMIMILAVVNKVMYFDKVNNLLNKLGNKLGK